MSSPLVAEFDDIVFPPELLETIGLAPAGAFQGAGTASSTPAATSSSEEGAAASMQPRTRVLKRKQVAMACKACRERKVRCSGEHPCHHCVKRKDECVFERPQKKQATEEIEILRNELHELRSTMQAVLGANLNGDLHVNAQPTEAQRVLAQDAQMPPAVPRIAFEGQGRPCCALSVVELVNMYMEHQNKLMPYVEEGWPRTLGAQQAMAAPHGADMNADQLLVQAIITVQYLTLGFEFQASVGYSRYLAIQRCITPDRPDRVLLSAALVGMTMAFAQNDEALIGLCRGHARTILAELDFQSPGSVAALQAVLDSSGCIQMLLLKVDFGESPQVLLWYQLLRDKGVVSFCAADGGQQEQQCRRLGDRLTDRAQRLQAWLDSFQPGAERTTDVLCLVAETSAASAMFSFFSMSKPMTLADRDSCLSIVQLVTSTISFLTINRDLIGAMGGVLVGALNTCQGLILASIAQSRAELNIALEHIRTGMAMAHTPNLVYAPSMIGVVICTASAVFKLLGRTADFERSFETLASLSHWPNVRQMTGLLREGLIS